MDQLKRDAQEYSRKKLQRERRGDAIALAVLILLALWLTFGKML